MKLKTKKQIIIISGLVLVAFAVFNIFYTPFPQLQWSLLAGLILVYTILGFVWIRCPYCNKYIRRFDQNYCAYCGKEIDDEEI